MGYRPVSMDKLRQNAEGARKWLNFHVLNENMTEYPADAILAHGNQLFEMVKYL